MLRIRGKRKAYTRSCSRLFLCLLMAVMLCFFPLNSHAEDDTKETADPGAEGQPAPSEAPSGGGTTTKKNGKPVISIDSVKLTKNSGTVVVSGGDSKVDMYYLLVRTEGQKPPAAATIKEEGYRTRDGFFSMPPLDEDVEYIFYAVAEDTSGRSSDIVSKRGASSASKGINIGGHVYCTLQTRDEIDDFFNQPGEITINAGPQKDVKKIEYIMADKFANSEGMIEAIATEPQDVTTASGTSSVNLSKWAEYDPYEKPGLIRNMLNYIYVRVTNADDTYTYYSSRGLWEDETEPTAQSVTGKADETTAVVEVTGEDAESGVVKYYFLLRDPIDLSAVKPEEVKKNGMSSDDGIFRLSGLSKRTRYDLYAVVEDKAGNLSQVRSGNMTTEGEATASSIRPSSDASDPGSKSHVAERTKGVTLEDPETTDTVSDRVPFLVGTPDKEYSGLMKIAGWDNIKTVAEKTTAPANLYVDMNGGATVPGDVLEKITGKNISFHFIMDDELTWVINGQYFNTAPMSTDLRVSRDSGHIPARLVNELAGVSPHQEFSVEHDGVFGFTAVLNIKLGEENSGKEAHLYVYDLNQNRLEHLQTETIDEEGSISFTIPGESDYVVLTGPVTTGERSEASTIETPVVIDETYKDFINTEEKSGHLWIILVGVAAVVLCIVILVIPKDKDKTGDEDKTDS